MDLDSANQVRREAWAKEAPSYDKRVGFFERRVFGREHRPWACSRARGLTLEVAVGTALNLPLYPPDVELVGLDLSPDMLAIARSRAGELRRSIDLHEGDAHSLPFEDDTFDTVVCTYSLCNIPDGRLAVREMKRVMRDDAKLILVDHIRSSNKVLYWIQKGFEFLSSKQGERFTRRPLEYVEAAGLSVIERDRLGPGKIVERLVAIKEEKA